MSSVIRLFAAVAAGFLTTWLGNLAATWWLRATDFDGDSFYDGCCGLLTLIIPALAAGIITAVIAKRHYGPASLGAFTLFSVVGLIHPFWNIPKVSAESAHSVGMHYVLYNPLVTLPVGMAAAWAAGQLVTGKWKLADDKPVLPD